MIRVDFSVANLKVICTKEEYELYCNNLHAHDYIRDTLSRASDLFLQRCKREAVIEANLAIRLNMDSNVILIFHYNLNNKNNPYLILRNLSTKQMGSSCKINVLLPLLEEENRMYILDKVKFSRLNLNIGKHNEIHTLTNQIDNEKER